MRESMPGGPAWRLTMAAREPDQAGRLAAFREAHPETIIEPGEFGSLHAWIPAANGHEFDGRLVVADTLAGLLGKLEGLFPRLG